MPDRTEKGGELVYKCRMCGEFDTSIGVPNIMRTLNDISIFGVTQNKGIKARMTLVHICDGHEWGIADLVGANEYFEDKED